MDDTRISPRQQGRWQWDEGVLLKQQRCPSAWLSHAPLSFSLQSFRTRNLSLQADLVLVERNNLWHISWGCFDNEKRVKQWQHLAGLPAFFLFILIIFFLKNCLKKTPKISKTMSTYQLSDKSNFETWCLCSSVGTVDINNSTKYYSHYYIWQYKNSAF